MTIEGSNSAGDRVVVEFDAMFKFDQLPAPIRSALRNAALDYSVDMTIEMLEWLRKEGIQAGIGPSIDTWVVSNFREQIRLNDAQEVWKSYRELLLNPRSIFVDGTPRHVLAFHERDYAFNGEPHAEKPERIDPERVLLEL